MSSAEPKTVDEVCALVRDGRTDIDLRRLDTVGPVEEGVLTVGGGALCGAVEERAHPWLFASDRPDSTVAEWIGRGGRGGVLSEFLGPARAQVLGLRAVLADGSCVRFGGKVVKNVAGYDLTKAFVGARGTLGLVVEAHLRVRPAPKGWRAAAHGAAIRFLRAGEETPEGYAACDPLEARARLRASFQEIEPPQLLGPLWERLWSALDPEGLFR